LAEQILGNSYGFHICCIVFQCFILHYFLPIHLETGIRYWTLYPTYSIEYRIWKNQYTTQKYGLDQRLLEANFDIMNYPWSMWNIWVRQHIRLHWGYWSHTCHPQGLSSYHLRTFRSSLKLEQRLIDLNLEKTCATKGGIPPKIIIDHHLYHRR